MSGDRRSADMDIFKCYECGLTSTDNVKANEHMEKHYKIKVVVDEVTKSHFCSMCKCKSPNMGEIKNHIMKEHEKESMNGGQKISRLNIFAKSVNWNSPRVNCFRII